MVVRTDAWKSKKRIPYGASWPEFEKTTADSIRPENVEDLSDEDKAKLDKDYSDIIVPFYNTTVEIEFDLLSKEDFYKLVEHNNIEKLIGYEYIYTKLVNNE